jgi:hypothetical protein
VLLDIDSEHGKMKDQDFIGYDVTTIGSLVGAKGQKLQKPIQKNQKPLHNAKITISAEEVQENKDIFKFTLAATVPKKGLLARPDPFFKVYRTKEDSSLVAVYTSKYQKDRTDCIWPSQAIPIQELCNSDLDRALIVKFFDWEKSGTHIYIGEFSSTVREFTGETAKDFALLKYHYPNNVKPDGFPAPRDKKPDKIGNVKVGPARVEHISSFFDYLKKGLRLSFSVAIDFTASNGAPSTPNSLHFYGGPGAPFNQYQQAIVSVANIIQEYDSDKSFPVFGFGAKLPTGEVSHCWALNGNPQNPGCPGVQGILDSYLLALRNVSLHGPTNFSPVLNEFSRLVDAELQARRQQGPQQVPWTYNVLLILTDGEITDMDSTGTFEVFGLLLVRNIIRASSLPCSIIIVGIGSGSDFANMNILDSDRQPLTDDSGRSSERDIVQFVALNRVIEQCRQTNAPYDAELARQVLAELPGQVLNWFEKRGMSPASL